MARQRLAVALLVPPRGAAQIDVVRRALGDADGVHRLGPHVTLVPPVNVAEDRLDEVEEVVRRAAAAARPVRTTLGPPATFLPDSPVLYLRVGPPPAAESVVELKDAVLVGPLHRPPAWPFVPHVTLLEGVDEDRLGAGVSLLAGLVVDVTFDAVALLREQRDGDGLRVWRPVLEAPLGGPAVVGRGGLPVELTVGRHLDAEAVAWFERGWDDHDRHLSGPSWAAPEPLAVTARRLGAVVGAAIGAVRDGEAHLERLLVDPSCRDEGVGGHLLAAFTSAAVERGSRRLVLRAVAGGDAERFYRERGFSVAAVLPRWRRGADFVLLERVLG